jgi:2-dehydro-3-deoxygalactonokinase
VSAGLVIGDWGSSRLRLWRLENGSVADRRGGPGIAHVGDPIAVLEAALGDWKSERVVLCGMAGARNGLREAPYVECPAELEDWRSHALEFALGGRTVAIPPGVVLPDGRPDVMRGEETQVFGAMACDPALASGRHLLVLPGTHSKWVQLSDGRIDSFRTFLTGELFDLLQRSSLFAAGSDSTEADVEAGFSDGLARRGALSSLLFEARSAQLVSRKSAGWASGFVSGVLIGAEVAAMEPEDIVTVIAEPELAARYSRALAHHGLEPATVDAEECTIAGLRLLDAGA